MKPQNLIESRFELIYWTLAMLIMGFALGFLVLSNDYKKGQVDAIQGKIKYEIRYDSSYVKIK